MTPAPVPCHKIKFSSQRAAKKMLKLARRRDPSFKGVVVYQCTRCGCWHLGNWLTRRQLREEREAERAGAGGDVGRGIRC